MNDALYDRIGLGYDATRRADPTIADLIAGALPKRGKTLDLGCGTGNYTIALHERGFDVCGADVSQAMLQRAKAKLAHLEWVRTAAEAMPFDKGAFAAVAAINVVHHFRAEAAFREVRRVLKHGGRFLIFGSMAEQIRGYWLAEYFPAAIERSAEEALSFGRLDQLCSAADLRLVDRIPWNQPEDPVDLFLYAGKHRPELYLNSAVRAGVSTFSKLMAPEELLQGLPRLAADIESGRIAEVIADAPDMDGDYSLLILQAC